MHLAVDVQPPVVRAVVNDRQNNKNLNQREQTCTLAGELDQISPECQAPFPFG